MIQSDGRLMALVRPDERVQEGPGLINLARHKRVHEHERGVSPVEKGVSPVEKKVPLVLVRDRMNSNFMYDLMRAIMKDQSTMSEQQLADAQSTMNATWFETAVYNYWRGVLTKAAQNVSNQANSGSNDTRSARVQAAQAAYSNDNANAQMYESQQDALVQATQGQTQSDATNLQMKAQIQQSANSILTTLVSMLGTITA